MLSAGVGAYSSSTKLDFSRSGGVGKCVGKVLDQCTGDFYQLRVRRRCAKTALQPEIAAHDCECVSEGGLVLPVPS